MNKIPDKIITGFFVGVLGILWYATRFRVKPEYHTVVIYDVFGKQTRIDGIRTCFKTHRVAQSYILEYQKRFPHHQFSLMSKMPYIKEKKTLRVFKTHR